MTNTHIILSEGWMEGHGGAFHITHTLWKKIVELTFNIRKRKRSLRCKA